MSKSYVVGVDLSTQNVKVVFVDLSGKLFASGSSSIPMISGENGEREGRPEDWKKCFVKAMKKAFTAAKKNGVELGKCLGICPSGMMHGEVLLLDDGSFYETARLWCDSRNADESRELTELFQWNTPQRLTISRWLWTIRNRPALAKEVVGITTPAGVLSVFLGAKILKLGFGEACGMLKVDPATGTYDAAMVEKFDNLVSGSGVRPILQLLPEPVMVGDVIGYIDDVGAKLSGLSVGTPIFSPEGDQPTTLAGTYASEEGVFSMSAGTSICNNLITMQAYPDIYHPGIEPFMTADGKPFLMIHVQNGTSFMNIVIKNLFGSLVGRRDPFDVVRQLAADAAVDCGGLVILPLAEPEHGLDLAEAARSGIFNLRADNATPGNMVRASFIGSMFSIRYSVEDEKKYGIAGKEIVASGGIGKSPWTYQTIADAFNLPVRVMGESKDCSPFGAALMALYGYRKNRDSGLAWGDFLKKMRPKDSRVIMPITENVAVYDQMFKVFCGLAKDVEDKMLTLPWVK